jgi:catechol-2,3-dioxygenase
LPPPVRRLGKSPWSHPAIVVFNTHRYEEMIDWYKRVFEARVQHRDDRLAFLTYDDEHHRFAFVNLGPAKDSAGERPATAAGLNHLAYTWRNLEELIDTYSRLKSQGTMPSRPIRHGLTLSLYYRDPDGNGLEFQIEARGCERVHERARLRRQSDRRAFRPGCAGGAACGGHAG